MVRWYAHTGQQDTLTRYGCEQLVWESSTRFEPMENGRQKKVKQSFNYQVINLASIKGMVYVVPDLKQGGDKYHTCAFKWVRQMPAIVGGANNNASYDSDDSD